MNYKDFCRLTEAERNDASIKMMWAAVERSANMIARARRHAELNLDISNEEFDKKLNELCEKAHSKYGDMNREQMMLDALALMVETLDADEIREILE